MFQFLHKSSFRLSYSVCFYVFRASLSTSKCLSVPVYLATYKTYKNKLTRIIRQSKKMHFKNKFELYKKDCRKTWNTINEVLKSKNKKHMVNDKFITSEGTSCTDKNEIVEQFNKYLLCFLSCIRRLHNTYSSRTGLYC